MIPTAVAAHGTKPPVLRGGMENVLPVHSLTLEQRCITGVIESASSGHLPLFAMTLGMRYEEFFLGLVGGACRSSASLAGLFRIARRMGAGPVSSAGENVMRFASLRRAH